MIYRNLKKKNKNKLSLRANFIVGNVGNQLLNRWQCRDKNFPPTQSKNLCRMESTVTAGNPNLESELQK